MAKNRKERTAKTGNSGYDWRADALREYESGSMTRSVAVILGIVEPLPFETVTSIDHSYAQDWMETFKSREQQFVAQQDRLRNNLRRYGHTGARAGKLDY